MFDDPAFRIQRFKHPGDIDRPKVMVIMPDNNAIITHALRSEQSVMRNHRRPVIPVDEHKVHMAGKIIVCEVKAPERPQAQ